MAGHQRALQEGGPEGRLHQEWGRGGRGGGGARAGWAYNTSPSLRSWDLQELRKLYSQSPGNTSPNQVT